QGAGSLLLLLQSFKASKLQASSFKLQSFKASKSQWQNQDNDNSKSFRLAASHFSLLAQRKVTKRKRALPRAFRAARYRSASMTGIRGRGILPLPRTAHIHVRRPFGVLPSHGRRFGREPSKSKAMATATAKARATATARHDTPFPGN
ncbi:hypothetical protein, partial [Xanthomonas graminis]|uniref:hypothetical protein n=1 Tax=Xanthomonas graminis TaxID=3390026 RepID=UPI001C3770EF